MNSSLRTRRWELVAGTNFNVCDNPPHEWETRLQCEKPILMPMQAEEAPARARAPLQNLARPDHRVEKWP